MNSVAARRGNKLQVPTIIGTPLPEATTFRWTGPKPVYHFLLTIRTSPVPQGRTPRDGETPQTVKFHAIRQDDPDHPSAKVKDFEAMCAYAKQLATSPRFTGRTAPLTPIDLNVDRQCWVLIELDRKINWRFSREYLACTTKEPEPPYPDKPHGLRSGYNLCLRYAYSNGEVVRFPSEAKRNAVCRFIFFGVVHRDQGVGQRFNLFVEFHQKDGRVLKVLPTLLDPDVPNDGTNEFPSPP
ncbi:MAG: nucleotide synthetase [Phenylobacterium sp.]